MIIDLFIKAGWHTVPLKGEIKRDEKGKKTIPIFPLDYYNKYTSSFNTKQVKVGGVLTGKISDIIAIDCDNQATYELFKTLDPNNKFHFVSKNKPAGGGTIIYKYSPAIETYSLNTNEIHLDVFSNSGMIYLPLEHNYSKTSWKQYKELPVIKTIPEPIYLLLSTFKLKVNAQEPKLNKRQVVSNRLAPLAEVFVKAGVYNSAFFKIITPFSFRDLPAYRNKGHLHPNNVPQGRGLEYLSKVSAILGADVSISVELYINCIKLINSLWKGDDRPKTSQELDTTIINPMVDQRANIDGIAIWQYDPYWQQMGFIASAVNGDLLESFFDDIKGQYYLINSSVPYTKVFSEKRPVINILRSLLGVSLSEAKYDTTKQLVRTVLSPHLEFGHIPESDQFNLFRQTSELAILNSPKSYSLNYKKPETILSFFSSLIPDDEMRTYVLRFIKTKMISFKYSPIILYFIGKPGSGKDTFVNILGKIVGEEYITKPETKVFLEQYNGWMVDKFFVQLDEYGNKLTRMAEKQEVLGKLKAYTGGHTIQIRAMRTDGYNYKHNITFISTANRNPLPIETGDRRICYIKTPNILAKETWVLENGGISNVHEKIFSEVKDFCYYLATEINTLPGDEYVIAPETMDKEQLILDNLPAGQKLLYYIQREKFEELKELADEYGISDFTASWDSGRLESPKLEALYSAITDGRGLTKSLLHILRSNGFRRRHTTRAGTVLFYYSIEGLHLHHTKTRFEKQPDKALKGL